MESEYSKSFARMLNVFSDDNTVREWRMKAVRANGGKTGAPARWGEV